MSNYRVFNIRGIQVGTVSAGNDAEALGKGKVIAPGAAVERILDARELHQKQYDDEVELWEAMRER